MKNDLRKPDLVYPELSYQIIGVMFDVYNKLGYGYKESVYQKAIAKALERCGIHFKEQVYSPIIFGGGIVGKNYFDFLIDDKVVLEIKKGDRFHRAHIEQLYQYLLSKQLKLGLLVYFSPQNLRFKRIVNLKNS